MTRRFAKYRTALSAKFTELSGGFAKRGQIAIEQTAEDTEKIEFAGQRDMAIRNLDQEARTLRQVRAALLRISDGSYGICQSCDREIPTKRLDALPWAANCVGCQEALDRAGAPASQSFRFAA